MMPAIEVISDTARRVASWISVTWFEISPVACEVWLASSLTSEATTANPLPASPARAASMVAFSASRLVCDAILEINSTTEPMCLAASSSERIAWLVRSASLTVVRAIARPR